MQRRSNPQQTLTAAEVKLLVPQTETEFQRQVIALAKQAGWLYYHTWRSIHSQYGFPDLVLVRGRRLVFMELKRQAGHPTIPQQKWLEKLRATGTECYLVRPSDWELIEMVLA